MRALRHNGKTHAVLAPLLGNTLHGLSGTLELGIAVAWYVGMCLLADQQQRELLEHRVPVIEFECQSSDLCGNHRAHIKRYRAQVDNGDLCARFTQAYKVAQQARQCFRCVTVLRIKQEVIAHVIHAALQAHEELVKQACQWALVLAEVRRHLVGCFEMVVQLLQFEVDRRIDGQVANAEMPVRLVAQFMHTVAQERNLR